MQDVKTMGTQVTIGTDVAEYDICIRPYKQKQDHEEMNVNVKSLVSIFEHDDAESGSCVDTEGFLHDDHGTVYRGKHLPDIVQCSAEFPDTQQASAAHSGTHICRRPERVIDDENHPVTLLAVKKKNSRKDLTSNDVDGIKVKEKLFSDHPHFIKNNIVTKYVVKEKIGHDLRRCYSDSWGSYGLADDAALLEALKDVIDKPPVARGGKAEKKSKRIRLPKKPPAPSKPFQEQVKDIFNPDKANSPGTMSSDSENDSEQGCPELHLPPDTTRCMGCRGTCQGTYNFLQAAGGYGESLCPVCHCSLKEGSDKVDGPRIKSENERAKKNHIQPARDVVNIVLVESSAQHGQWPPPSAAASLETKPTKVSKRDKATVERKVFEVCKTNLLRIFVMKKF